MNIKKFLTDVAASFGRESIVFLRGILLIPVITKLLGVDAFGIWATVLAIATIVGTLSGLNLPEVVVRYTSAESEDGQVFIDALVLCVVSSAIVSVLLLFVGLTVPELFPGIEASTTVAMSVMVFATGTNLTVKSYPRALDEIKLFEVFNVGQKLLEIIILVPVFYITRSITYGIVAFTAISLFVSVVVIVSLVPTPVPKPNVSNFGDYLRFSLPLMPQTLSSRLLRNSDKYLITLFVGPSATGVYSVVVSVSKMIENLGGLLNPALYPKVVQMWEEENTTELQQLYEQILRGFVIFGFPAVAGMSLLGPDILTLLSDDTVAVSGSAILPLVALSYLVIAFSGPLAFIFHASENTVRFMYVYLAGVVLNIVSNLLLIPLYGVFGAVVATLITYVLIAVLIYIISRSKIEYSIPFRTVARSIVGTTLMIAVLWFVPWDLPSTVRLAVIPPLGILVYMTTIVITGELRYDERRLVVNYLR